MAARFFQPLSRSALAVMIALVACGAAVAGPSPRSEDASEAEVKELLDELDSDTLAARAAAERRLIELGPEILPHLPAPELLTNVSLRESVRRLRVRLERTKAEQSIEPSRVTLDGKMTVHQALQAVARQTGNRLSPRAVPAKAAAQEIEVAIEKETFWEALEAIATRAGLAVIDEPGEAGLALAEAGEATAPRRADHSGAARVSTTGASLRPLVGDESQKLLRVPVVVAMEPRLRPLFAHYSGRDVHAVRSDGTSLPPFTPEAKYEVPLLEGGHAFAVTLDYYRTPADTVPETIALRGEIGVLMAAGTEEFAFSDLSKSRRVARRRAGVTVTLLDATAEPEEDGTQRVKIGMSVVYDVGGPAFESHRQWMFYNEAWLEDGKGRRIPREAGFSTRQQADGAVVVEYEFANVPGNLAAWRFVYSAPTLLIDVPVEFRIDDVPVKSKRAE